MCFRISTDFSDVDVKNNDDFKVTEVLDLFNPRFNVSITSKIPVITPGSRILSLMKWGLIPYWAKDEKIGQKLANARSETIDEKPSFKDSFHKHRCLILVSGFFEWDIKKNPYHIKVKDKKIFALAGLFAEWTNEEGKLIKSCTVITTEPNRTIKRLHDRMPVILNSEDYETWLTSEDKEELKRLLVPFEDKSITCEEVSRKVNSVKNNSPDLLIPIKSTTDKQKKLL